MIPPIAAGPGTNDTLAVPVGVFDLKSEEDPLDAVVEAESRTSSRPGSQAPHAPPALTFGLPGKQKVNPTGWGRVLISFVSSLPVVG